MRSKNRWAVAAGLLASLSLSACAEVAETKHKAVEPYKKVETNQAGLYRVTLAESAVQRLDLKTTLVQEARAKDGRIRRVIPYAAIIYDLNGETWTYTSPESLIFVRERIEVDYIDGDRVFLLEGPRNGTAVVIAGAAELYGIEFGLGK